MTQPDPNAKQRPHLELVSVEGNATDEERSGDRSRARHGDRGGAQRTRGLRLEARLASAKDAGSGMYDYRDRFAAEDAWRLSARFPTGGREYPGLNGRGDAK